MSDAPNAMTLLSVLFLAFWSFASIFVFCDSGERIASEFDEIDIYNLCDWYLFPANIEKAIPIVIMNTQLRPVVLEGFGNIQCSRETFKRVISCET